MSQTAVTRPRILMLIRGTMKEMESPRVETRGVVLQMVFQAVAVSLQTTAMTPTRTQRTPMKTTRTVRTGHGRAWWRARRPLISSPSKTV